MIASVRPSIALLVGVALLLAGSGLLGSLLAVRGELGGFSAQTLGLIMSAYVVGFFPGTFAAPDLIQRIGRIRGFHAALAAAVLLHPVSSPAVPPRAQAPGPPRARGQRCRLVCDPEVSLKP